MNLFFTFFITYANNMAFNIPRIFEFLISIKSSI